MIYIGGTRTIKVFLDDERVPPSNDWCIVRNALAFLEAIRKHRATAIAFDHDLGSDRSDRELPNGQHCMHLLIEEAMDHPEAFAELDLIILHSANPVGRANMRGLIESAQHHGILGHVHILEMPVTSFPIALWDL